jgi:hypothetical protein
MARQKRKRRGRYYLARVRKAGQLTETAFRTALLRPSSVILGDYAWTFTDLVVGKIETGEDFIFGQLTRYEPSGVVAVLDLEHHATGEQIARDLIVGSAPFVYIPSQSGIAYMHVWDIVDRAMFITQFVRVILEYFRNFFVECEIEPIVDLRTFAAKLQDLDIVTEIEAKVHPPNPLFGRAWESLDAYIKNRNARELKISEQGTKDEPLKTELASIATALASDAEQRIPDEVDVTDAAVLMAADGYGSGKVGGYNKDTEVVVLTSQTQLSFLFSKTPAPESLAAETLRRLQSEAGRRALKHR